MKIILLLFLNIFCISATRGQTAPISFSDAISPHLKKYNIESNMAFAAGDLERGQRLFDSLVSNYLVGSQIDDYALKNVNGGKVKLSEIKKPVFIMTYASWCVLSKGEIPALNKLSKKYAKEVQFVILFYDKKQHVKKISRRFSGNIKVCYANESYRNDVKLIAAFKHTLGFPTSFFLNENLEVVAISRGGAQTSQKSTYINAFNLNYELFDGRLSSSLLKKTFVMDQLASDDY